jgi:hypothetical protein
MSNMSKIAALVLVCAPCLADAEEAAPARWVPASVVAASQVAHPAPRLPREWIAGHPGVDQVQGMYKVCLGDDGTVAAVAPLRHIEGADAAIAVQIAENWRYQPNVAGLCFASILKFQIEEPAIRMTPPGGALFPHAAQLSAPRHR